MIQRTKLYLNNNIKILLRKVCNIDKNDMDGMNLGLNKKN